VADVQTKRPNPEKDLGSGRSWDDGSLTTDHMAMMLIELQFRNPNPLSRHGPHRPAKGRGKKLDTYCMLRAGTCMHGMVT